MEGVIARPGARGRRAGAGHRPTCLLEHSHWGHFLIASYVYSEGGVATDEDNDDFLDGKRREQDPIYSVQGGFIYGFRNGIWAALNGTYFTGGRTTVGGVEGDDLQKNSRAAIAVALPVSRRNSVKFYASTGVFTRTGSDFDTVGLGWQYRWGGGP